MHTSLPQPRLAEVGVIALVPDQWGPYWQARHHVLSRLANHFQVVWTNCPAGWRDCFSTLRRSLVTSRKVGAIPDGLQVYESEFWLPRVGRPTWLAQLTSQKRLARASGLLRARGCTKFVLYLWRPEFADALDQIPHDLSIYHVDDEYSFSSS